MDPDDYDMLLLELEQDNAISRRKARKKAKELADAQDGDWEECVPLFCYGCFAGLCDAPPRLIFKDWEIWVCVFWRRTTQPTPLRACVSIKPCM